MSRRRRLPLGLAVLAGTLLHGALAYPTIMLQPKHCSTLLEEGSSIMGAPAFLSKEDPPITVTRNGNPLASGDKYTPGDYVTVTYTGKGQALLEAGGKALFNNGYCSESRVATTDAGLALPMGEAVPDVTIKVAYATKFGKVAITNPFVLKAPSSAKGTGNTTTPAGGAATATRPPATTTTTTTTTAPASTKPVSTGGGGKDGVYGAATLKHSDVLDADNQVVISYEVSPDKTYADVQISASPNSWVGLGVMENGPVQMVNPSNPHRVFVYPYADGQPAFVALNGMKASSILPVAMPADNLRVLLAQSTAEGVVLRVRVHPSRNNPNAGMAATLDFVGKNTIMWAHSGGAWPAMHSASEGVVVDWVLGQITAVERVVPYFFPGQVLFLLPLLALPFTLRLTRTTGLGRFLTQKRIGCSVVKPAESYLGRAWNNVTAFTVGEVLMVLAYLLAHLALMGHWHNKAYAMDGNHKYAATTATGYGGLTNLMMVSLPITKTSLWVKLLGVPFDRAVKFHRVLARYTLVVLSLHFALASDVYWFEFWSTRDLKVVTGWGFVALCIFIFVSLSAIDIIRRRVFEAFKILHYASYFGLAAVALHLPGEAFGLSYFVPTVYLCAPIALYLIDLTLRLARTGMRAGIVEMKPLPENAVRLRVAVSALVASHEAGSYYFINLPAISNVQWHPYSVAYLGPETLRFASDGAPQTPVPVLTFIIKSEGGRSWSAAVEALAAHMVGKSSEARALRRNTKVRVDGPYGHMGVSARDYSALLLVGGGVGITPLTSLLGYIGRERAARRLQNLEVVELVWAVKSATQLSWIEELLVELQSTASRKKLEEDDDKGEERKSSGEASSRFSERKMESRGPDSFKTALGPSSYPLPGAFDDDNGEVEDEEEQTAKSGPRPLEFRLRLHVTRVDRADVTESGVRYEAGRPDLKKIVSAFAADAKRRPKGGAMVTCGPAVMMAELRNAAGKHGLSLHEEVFRW